MSIIIAKTTCPNIEESRKISRHLIEKRLVSSANFFPINSMSAWSGKIEEVGEYIVFLKTKEENWEKTRDEIKKFHSYKVPCILKLSAEASEGYDSWIKKETS
jgi:periplasmic divalent cation tolerance protein